METYFRAGLKQSRQIGLVFLWELICFSNTSLFGVICSETVKMQVVSDL